MLPIPVGRLLENWFDDLPDAARQRLLIVVENECEHHFLQADIEAAKIVLNNLFDNACRYSPDDSTVLIYLCLRSNRLCLYVADWGSGVPDQLRDLVFDRFRRLEQHRDPARADGAGLGLAVAKALLNQMNAEISLLPNGGQPIDCVPSTVFEICFDSHGLVHQADRSAFDVDVSIDLHGGHRLIHQLKSFLDSQG
jgi:K+-sensing histidine kinase KdpD